MTTYTGKSLTVVAQAWANKKTRKAAQAYLVEKAATSKRKRWANAAKAAQAGDELRMAAYAAEGRDATKAAWSAVAKAGTAAPKAEAKAKTAKAATVKTDELAAKLAAFLAANI